MKIYTNKIPNYIINVLTVFLLFSFTSLNMVTWGRYAFLAISFAIFLISSSKYCGGVKFTVQPFHVFLFLFACYCGLSAMWAINPRDSVTDCKTIFQILICFSLIYVHYQKEQNIDTLINILKYSGVLVVFYTIFFYGLDNVIKATQDDRLGTEFANTNTVGMIAAITFIIVLYNILERKKYTDFIIAIPCIVIVAATQSRKALIASVIGGFIIIILKNVNNKKFFVTLLKVVLSLVAMFIIVYYISKIPMLSGAIHRLQRMFEAFTGGDEADSSAIARINMVHIGMESFKKHPFLGIGMKNTHFLADEYIGRNTYLHNNYVDVLAGGGIVGFCVYYSMYIFLFYNTIKYKDIKKEDFIICITLLILIIILDYGAVTYYSKQQYFYLMILFLHIDNIKRQVISDGNTKETIKSII